MPYFLLSKYWIPRAVPDVFLATGRGGGVVWQIIVLLSRVQGVEVGGSKGSLLIILLYEFHKFDFPN